MEEFISVPLSIIFNKSFNIGSLPQDWKCAHVTPIHKKGARNLVSNYRPVSLISIFSKMIESLIKDHVMDYSMAYNLISPYQFGFMQGRSCAMQLLHILDYIIDKGHSVEMIVYHNFKRK